MSRAAPSPRRPIPGEGQARAGPEHRFPSPRGRLGGPARGPSSPQGPPSPSSQRAAGEGVGGGAIGRDPDAPLPEPSRNPQALTSQEQHTRQSEPPDRLHGGRSDKRRAPGAAAPRSRARPEPPPIPLERPRPSPSALSTPGWGGPRHSVQWQRTTPNMQPMESFGRRGLQPSPPIVTFHVRFPAVGAWPAPIGGRSRVRPMACVGGRGQRSSARRCDE